MKRFVLYSARYDGALCDFAAKAAAAEVIYIRKNCKENARRTLVFAVRERDAFYRALLDLLCDIAEAENPVYRHSPQLRGMARELRHSPVYSRELRRLRQFVAGSRELFLEGYATFRMSEFREKLDSLIYSLVKKIKFGN